METDFGQGTKRHSDFIAFPPTKEERRSGILNYPDYQLVFFSSVNVLENNNFFLFLVFGTPDRLNGSLFLSFPLCQ